MFKQFFSLWLLAFAAFFVAGVWGIYADECLGLIYAHFWFVLTMIIICIAFNRNKKFYDYAKTSPKCRFRSIVAFFIVICYLCYNGGKMFMSLFM